MLQRTSFGGRSFTTTSAPSAANCSAIARPIPEPAAVTIATFLLKRPPADAMPPEHCNLQITHARHPKPRAAATPRLHTLDNSVGHGAALSVPSNAGRTERSRSNGSNVSRETARHRSRCQRVGGWLAQHAILSRVKTTRISRVIRKKKQRVGAVRVVNGIYQYGFWTPEVPTQPLMQQ